MDPGPVGGFAGDKAEAAGLVPRSPERTAEDALRWHRDRGAPALTAGLSAARETELLAALGAGS